MENLTKQQEATIKKIESLGFKKDEKMSGFEKEQDGTEFYTFYAKHGMGVQMIQKDGSSEGNLINQKH